MKRLNWVFAQKWTEEPSARWFSAPKQHQRCVEEKGSEYDERAVEWQRDCLAGVPSSKPSPTTDVDAMQCTKQAAPTPAGSETGGAPLGAAVACRRV